MSGFWIKWEKGLTHKPEILQISARLMIPPTQAAGSLMLVMEWLDDAVTILSRDGHADVPLGALQTTFIDGIAGVSGFAESLAEVGWLRSKDGVLTFVNVGNHNLTSAKSRALAADRKRRERSRSCHDDVTIKKAAICSVSESALICIYEAYPRRQGRAAALKAITKAIDAIKGDLLNPRDSDWLLARVKAYAEAVSKWPESEKQFIPHPATWFNRGSYDDDPETWVKTPADSQRSTRRAGFAT